MQTTHFSFNFMPEIEDEIFERTARAYPGYASTLSVVSKRVQTLVERLMYETIVFESRGHHDYQPNVAYAERFEPTLHARPAEFFATHVRNVCITTAVPDEITALIFAKCTGIQNLAFWRADEPLDNMLVIALPSSLRTLLTDRLIISGLASTGAVLPDLKLLGARLLPNIMPIPALIWLPSLTTVRLDIENEPLFSDLWINDIKTIISTTSKLESLLLDVRDSCLGIVITHVDEMTDKRIVVRASGPIGNEIEEWRDSWMA